MSQVFEYSQDLFKFNLNWNENGKSEFDQTLETSWQDKCDKGYFKYTLKIVKQMILHGEYKFLAQLNMDRATNRRVPEDLNAVNLPFDQNTFNFTKMEETEIILRLIYKRDDFEDESGDYIVINVSPLERGHSLLLPSLYECLPQVVTLHGLRSAVSTLLLSHSPALRIGFNGLCAYATVNHMHYHCYYLQTVMLLETIEVEELCGNCYLLLQYPAVGYAFQITSVATIDEVLTDIHKITTYLTESEIAHNLYMTRGLSFDKCRGKGSSLDRDCIRIYLWARKSACGIKQVEAFNPALCELFGHLVIKTEDFYNRLTEDSVSRILSEVTNTLFHQTKPKIREILLK